MKKKFTPYALLIASFILIAVFKGYPILYSLWGSLFTKGAGGVTHFAGLDNFIMLFKDPDFLNSVLMTLKFTLIITPIQVILAVGLALLLNKNHLLVRATRTIVYIPVAVNLVVATTIWNLMLNPSSGIINSILNIFGIESQPFLTSPDQAMWVIMVICCWKGVAYWMMFLLAGLQNINDSIYEAGRIDGTNFFSELFSLTLPMLKNSLVFVAISDTMINLFMFVPVYMLTGGGPQGSTNVLMYEAYRSAFKFSNYGRSYAIITVLLIITCVIIGIQFWFTRDKDEPRKRKRVKGRV
jgi:multiple sugar transport system permease protein